MYQKWVKTQRKRVAATGSMEDNNSGMGARGGGASDALAKRFDKSMKHTSWKASRTGAGEDAQRGERLKSKDQVRGCTRVLFVGKCDKLAGVVASEAGLASCCVCVPRCRYGRSWSRRRGARSGCSQSSKARAQQEVAVEEPRRSHTKAAQAVVPVVLCRSGEVLVVAEVVVARERLVGISFLCTV